MEVSASFFATSLNFSKQFILGLEGRTGKQDLIFF